MVFRMRMSGVLWAVNCNWNGDGWNVDANPVDDPNRWNDGNQVFSRNSDISPAYLVGVFFSKSPFLQAPKFLPISSSFSESLIYLSLGISLFSQASWTKNFRTSRWKIIFPNIIIFCSGGKYVAVKFNSRITRNIWSILRPNPYLSVLGKLR